MRQLSSAVLLYTQDFDNRYPTADRWADSIEASQHLNYSNDLEAPSHDSDRDIFHCPAAQTPHGYAFNEAFGGRSVNTLDVPGTDYTVLLFETDSLQKNAHGSQSDLAKVRRLNLNIAFADGTVKWMNEYYTTKARWAP